MNCLFPGSFDPVTNGHMDLIRRCAKMFDTVYVAVMHNVEKKGLFTKDERVDMLKKCVEGMDNVQVVAFSGLTVDLCRQLNVRVLVRGVRSVKDFESESTLHRLNHMLDADIETLFLPASSGMEDVSSSAVRELASFRGEADMFLPGPAAKMIREKFADHH